MKSKILVCLFLMIGLVSSGCAQKKVAQPVKPEEGMQQQQATLPSGEPADKKGMLRPEERISEQELAKIETREEVPAYDEERGLFKDIYFDYDKYEVRQDAKEVLQDISSWLMKNTSAKLLVEGHCDERGTNEYNLALGDRRAKAVRDYLVALGISSGRIEMISYGEEKPICLEQTEECWSENRRAHFVVLRDTGK